ncbi:hypothetical protein ACFYUD_31885 [Nocardia tengchongensis]|uniref:hypothetical protein n=1 Tax=Nocardia tengchongensis TaxID=2055889 RepID=UPI0036CB3256
MTMRALVGGKGADWILENRDLPEQLGAVRVQVMAAGLNRADLYALDGSNPIQTIDAGLIGGDPAAMTAMLEALG